MFGWLFRKSNYHRFQDSYALNRDGMMAGMLEAIESRLEAGDVVFLLAHFPNVFSEILEQIENAGIGYSIVTDPLDVERVKQLSGQRSSQVYLSMAPMLRVSNVPQIKEDGPRVAIVLCQRHPMPKYDGVIAEWCRQLPFPVQLGYFLSLDDPVVNHVVSDQAKVLLQQFGLGENELITSSMVSRRLDTVLKRKAAKVAEEKSADSAQEWLNENYS